MTSYVQYTYFILHTSETICDGRLCSELCLDLSGEEYFSFSSSRAKVKVVGKMYECYVIRTNPLTRGRVFIFKANNYPEVILLQIICFDILKS